jgi:hypothetical protein
MPFFERPEPPPEDEDLEDEDDVDLLDETNRYLGGAVPLQLLLARSESAAVAIRGLVAYPDGFEFTVVTFTRRRPNGRRRRRRLMRPMLIHPFERRAAVVRGHLRLHQAGTPPDEPEDAQD